jgi:hypothetical protein
MERVRRTEVDSIDEVAKVFNRIIDHINLNDEHNAEVDVHNAEVDKFNKSIGMKGAK